MLTEKWLLQYSPAKAGKFDQIQPVIHLVPLDSLQERVLFVLEEYPNLVGSIGLVKRKDDIRASEFMRRSFKSIQLLWPCEDWAEQFIF